MLISTTMRNAIADAVDATIGTSATLEFQTAASAEVATLTLQNPAFGDAATGVITLAGTPLSDTSATGNASAVTKAIFKASGTTNVLELSVGTTGSDINFAAGVIWDAGDTVTLTSLTITCPDGT